MLCSLSTTGYKNDQTPSDKEMEPNLGNKGTTNSSAIQLALAPISTTEIESHSEAGYSQAHQSILLS